MATDVVVVDTGGANFASVAHALARAGKRAEVLSDPDRIRRASHVIVPGVGSAGRAMETLKRFELVACLRELRCPLLGICLGLQLLFERSEELGAACLGLLPGTVRRLHAEHGSLVVPHMGWNQIDRVGECRLLDGVDDGAYVYFVHSYAAPMGPWARAVCSYGRAFPAIIEHDNLFGVQFHPERSSAIGARILDNFLGL